jgi:hypothetical protein
MLKAQLGSKVPRFFEEFPEENRNGKARWWEIEDLLTSDFWGVIDYLPRTYLKRMLEHARSLSQNVIDLELSDCEWNATELRFWPSYTVNDARTEPDVVIVSSRWIIVVEVKLHAGLGNKQPWREYQVGCTIAGERGISNKHVYYLVVTLRPTDIASTFDRMAPELKILQEQTLYLQWSEVIALVDQWQFDAERENASERRMLGDLAAVLRRRRTLAFSGFKLRGLPCTAPELRLFAPEIFNGFLRRAHQCLSRTNIGAGYFVPDVFYGFLRQAERCLPPKDARLLFSLPYTGFRAGQMRIGCHDIRWLHNLDFQGFLRNVTNLPVLRVWQCDGDRS